MICPATCCPVSGCGIITAHAARILETVDNEKAKEVWQHYWAQNRDEELSLDGMSRTILSELLRNCGDVARRKVLEAGCGRGLISAELASCGADVSLLDASEEALQIARKHFAAQNLDAFFVQGDILSLPFGDSTFDIVWNAGVMEHFEGSLRETAVRGIAQRIRPAGLFVSFNPSADAFFYTLGKKFAEKRGKWPYGPEFPLKSLAEECNAAGLTVMKEYQICFKENLSYLSYVSKHLRSIVKLMVRPFSQEFLTKIFGGYLLVTVAQKRI